MTSGAKTHPRVEVLERRTVYRGYFRMDAYRLRFELHEGGWSGEITRELFERGHAAGILLFDPERDAVVLVEQFRIGALAAGREPWLVEIAAGIVEAGESGEDVVRREAVEETGCAVTDLVHIQDYLSSPGGTSEVVSLYCGRVDSGAAERIAGLREEHEDIKVHVLPHVEVIAMLEAGRLANAAAVIAVAWLARHHDALVARWTRA